MLQRSQETEPMVLAVGNELQRMRDAILEQEKLFCSLQGEESNPESNNYPSINVEL